MPVTPFHMGPAMVIKTLLHDKFSLIVFGIAQVLIDLQPAFAMATGSGAIHGWTHTYLGATVIALVTIAIARPTVPVIVRYWNTPFTGPSWLADFEEQPGWQVIAVSAFLGTYSHVLFDSVMHGDMTPFWPLIVHNVLLGYVGAWDLHIGFFILGILAAVAFFCIRYRTRP